MQAELDAKMAEDGFVDVERGADYNEFGAYTMPVGIALDHLGKHEDDVDRAALRGIKRVRAQVDEVRARKLEKELTGPPRTWTEKEKKAHPQRKRKRPAVRPVEEQREDIDHKVQGMLRAERESRASADAIGITRTVDGEHE